MDILQNYKSTEIGTSNNVRIVLLLYNGAINYMLLARKKLEHGNITGKGHYIVKSTAIVTELSNSLDDTAGEIATNLGRLYDFVIDRLLAANLKNDVGALNEAIETMMILRDAWKEIADHQDNSNTVSEKNPAMVLKA